MNEIFLIFKQNLVFFVLPGDKPHACELCNKRFALACNLRAHMKTHEGKSRHFPLSHLAASFRGCRFKLSARRPPGTCLWPTNILCVRPLKLLIKKGSVSLTWLAPTWSDYSHYFRFFYCLRGSSINFHLVSTSRNTILTGCLPNWIWFSI